jgi:hypothetical protein
MSTAAGGSFRNRIINGDMRIDQRNAGASVSGLGAYAVDRFWIDYSQASKYTAQQNAGSVTPPAGFTNYLGITSSAATGVGTSDYFSFQQSIEGFNVADLAWGTASAKTVTISFWIRSSLTGTFGGALRNSANNRSYPFTYSISSANTWEYKTVTIAGDTSGTWLTNNGIGVAVIFSLGMGSTYSGTAGAWAGANYGSATGATNVVSTNGATLYITGVQLEQGSTATEFERRPIGVELALCQRYCFVAPQNWAYAYGGSGSALVNFSTAAYFPVPMRVTPVVSALSFTVVNCSSPAEAALISYRVSYFTFNTANGFAAFGNNAGAIYNAEL